MALALTVAGIGSAQRPPQAGSELPSALTARLEELRCALAYTRAPDLNTFRFVLTPVAPKRSM
jgi:hypothetical protein